MKSDSVVDSKNPEILRPKCVRKRMVTLFILNNCFAHYDVRGYLWERLAAVQLQKVGLCLGATASEQC